MSGHDDWHRDDHSSFDPDLHRSSTNDSNFSAERLSPFDENPYDPYSDESHARRARAAQTYNPLNETTSNRNISKNLNLRVVDVALMFLLGSAGAVLLSLII